MSILNADKTETQNEEILKAEVKNRFIDETNNVFRSTVFMYNDLMKLFWENTVLPPEKVAEALGEDGASLFQLGSLLKNAILSASPSENIYQVPTDKYTVTPQPNGEITVTHK